MIVSTTCGARCEGHQPTHSGTISPSTFTVTGPALSLVTTTVTATVTVHPEATAVHGQGQGQQPSSWPSMLDDNYFSGSFPSAISPHVTPASEFDGSAHHIQVPADPSAMVSTTSASPISPTPSPSDMESGPSDAISDTRKFNPIYIVVIVIVLLLAPVLSYTLARRKIIKNLAQGKMPPKSSWYPEWLLDIMYPERHRHYLWSPKSDFWVGSHDSFDSTWAMSFHTPPESPRKPIETQHHRTHSTATTGTQAEEDLQELAGQNQSLFSRLMNALSPRSSPHRHSRVPSSDSELLSATSPAAPPTLWSEKAGHMVNAEPRVEVEEELQQLAARNRLLLQTLQTPSSSLSSRATSSFSPYWTYPATPMTIPTRTPESPRSLEELRALFRDANALLDRLKQDHSKVPPASDVMKSASERSSINFDNLLRDFVGHKENIFQRLGSNWFSVSQSAAYPAYTYNTQSTLSGLRDDHAIAMPPRFRRPKTSEELDLDLERLTLATELLCVNVGGMHPRDLASGKVTSAPSTTPSSISSKTSYAASNLSYYDPDDERWANDGFETVSLVARSLNTSTDVGLQATPTVEERVDLPTQHALGAHTDGYTPLTLDSPHHRRPSTVKLSAE